MWIIVTSWRSTIIIIANANRERSILEKKSHGLDKFLRAYIHLCIPSCFELLTIHSSTIWVDISSIRLSVITCTAYKSKIRDVKPSSAKYVIIKLPPYLAKIVSINDHMVLPAILAAIWHRLYNCQIRAPWLKKLLLYDIISKIIRLRYFNWCNYYIDVSLNMEMCGTTCKK